MVKKAKNSDPYKLAINLNDEKKLNKYKKT